MSTIVFFPSGDVELLKTTLECLYQPETDRSGLTGATRTDFFLTRLEERIEAVLAYFESSSTLAPVVGHFSRLLSVFSLAFSMVPSSQDKETTEMVELRRCLPTVHSLYWRLLKGFLDRYGRRVFPYCDIIEGFMLHELNWTKEGRSQPEIREVRAGVYTALGELVVTARDLNSQHLPVFLDHLVLDTEINEASSESLPLAALRGLHLLLESGVALQDCHKTTIAEALVVLVTRQQVAVSEEVLKMATCCIGDLLRLKVSMETDVILEHLCCKSDKCYQQLARLVCTSAMPRRLQFPGNTSRHQTSESQDTDRENVRVLRNPVVSQDGGSIGQPEPEDMVLSNEDTLALFDPVVRTNDENSSQPIVSGHSSVQPSQASVQTGLTSPQFSQISAQSSQASVQPSQASAQPSQTSAPPTSGPDRRGSGSPTPTAEEGQDSAAGSEDMMPILVESGPDPDLDMV